MISNTNVMLNNTVELAKKQLEAHVQRGANSTLSVYEVARLMDTIRFQKGAKKFGGEPQIVGFSNN
ncbi:MAG: hypothetical protein COA32_09975 [Fluviicola sp.]|nr:MAG: hypothetical protein COA32_09975 [Fluviicola sp.]